MTSTFGWLDQDDAQSKAMLSVVELFKDALVERRAGGLQRLLATLLRDQGELSQRERDTFAARGRVLEADPDLQLVAAFGSGVLSRRRGP